MSILKTMAFTLSFTSVFGMTSLHAESRANIAMLEYEQVFDKSGKPLDLILKGATPGWHCESVDSSGKGHDCTLTTSSKEESKGDSPRFLKVVSYRRAIDVNTPLYLTGEEEYLKDWHCKSVDQSGTGHDCDWVDVIITEE